MAAVVRSWEQTVDLARSIPKTELHIHLDGSLDEEYIAECATERGVALPCPPGEIRGWLHGLKRKAIQETGNKADAGKNWGVFDFCNQFLQLTSELERATRNLCLRLRRENVRLAEIRFCPSLHCDEGLTEEQVVEAVLRGFHSGASQAMPEGSALPSLTGGVILCALRSFPAEHFVQMAVLADKYASHGVVGYDIAGDEGNYPLLACIEGLRTAKRLGVPFTVHAGEWPTGTVPNIKLAVEEGARRIGHAITLHQDKALMSEVARLGVVVESCLTANVGWKVPSYREHPISHMLEAGVQVCLNSDNLLLSGAADRAATPSNEVAHFVQDLCDGSFAQVKGLLVAGSKAAFTPAADKQWQESFVREVDTALQGIPDAA